VPDSIVPDGPGGPRRNAPASARAPVSRWPTARDERSVATDIVMAP